MKLAYNAWVEINSPSDRAALPSMTMAQTTKHYDLLQSYEAPFLDLLDATLAVMEPSGIPYVFVGGLAARAYGRRRYTHDVDIFVRFEDADRTLECFEKAGFVTEETNPVWIYKAFTKFGEKDAVIDILFKSRGEIFLDQEMIRRARYLNYQGRKLPVLAPEDFLVIKALAHDSETPRHWLDALAIIRNAKLDWPYLVKRAKYGPRRLLSLLLYAQSIDLVVPNEALRAIFSMIDL